MKSTNPDPRHPIRIVARRTGLKPDLIRAWERRYGAVEPRRSESGRRLYTDADIRRFQLLQQAVEAGRGIRLVAELSDEALEHLIAEDRGVQLFRRPARRTAEKSAAVVAAEEMVSSVEAWMEPCLEAILALDEKMLENLLLDASVALSRFELLDGLLAPMMNRVGELWRQGNLRPIHEHMATAVLRTFIGNLKDSMSDPGAPHILVTTPVGQRHEIGALLASICAASEGWNVTFFGCDLPAEEIAAGARQKGSTLIALSATYPPDDSRLPVELLRLHSLVSPAVGVVVGGRAACSYRSALVKSGIEIVGSLEEFRRILESSRFSKDA